MSTRYTADLVVLAPDRPDVALIAEVKAVGAQDSDEQLRRYMLDRGCPLGLVVTPATTRIYRDAYRDFTDSSIDLVAELSTEELLGPVDAGGTKLERQLFDWLERMASFWHAALPASETAKAAVVEHIVPAVAEGRVMLHDRAA